MPWGPAPTSSKRKIASSRFTSQGVPMVFSRSDRQPPTRRTAGFSRRDGSYVRIAGVARVLAGCFSSKYLKQPLTGKL